MGSLGALVMILTLLGVGREPEPTEVFCAALDWAGALRVGESLMMLNVVS